MLELFGKFSLAAGVLVAGAFGAVNAQAASLTLDGDTAATGSTFGSNPVFNSALGAITFTGGFRPNGTSDPDYVAAGAAGNGFNILAVNTPAVFDFDFDISSISFIYGGNLGDITVEARNGVGAIVDSFFQANTGDGFPAGPVILSGLGIRSLSWFDTDGTYAILDNVTLTTSVSPVPLPAAFPLFGTALGLLGFVGLRRRRRAT